MATYNITASLTLSTEIEPVGEFENSEAANLSDESSFGYEYVRQTGEVSFQVEADDEDAARAETQRLLDDMTFYSNSDIEWEVSDGEIDSIEADEVPMDKARAVSLIEAYLSAALTSGIISSEQKEAFEFMLAYVSGMTT